MPVYQADVPIIQAGIVVPIFQAGIVVPIFQADMPIFQANLKSGT